ncbi:S49 family peptidase [Spirosoma areae]
MNKQHILDITAFSAIQTWLIDPEIRDLLLAQLVEKGQIVFTLDETPIHYTDYNWAYYVEASQPNSVAVITIKGVIYDYYADYLVGKLALMAADKNLIGAVIKMNSPGGSADAGYRIADAVVNLPFPTHCHVDYGQASSAGYLIGCSCDSMSASRVNDRVGSIGTYISYQDWSKYYEKLGIVSKDVYAEQSSEKNIEGREAAKGNFKPLQAYVSQEAQAFIDYVKSRRPGLETDKQDPFKGKVFSAKDALNIGLIDSIGTLKEAVSAVSTKNLSSNTTPRTSMLGFIKLAALLAIKGVEASALTPEQMDAVNKELVAAGFKGIVMCTEADYEKAVEAINAQGDSTALAAAQAEVTRLTTELTTANSKVTTLTNDLTTQKNEVTRLGGLNGAEKTLVAKPNETQADAGQDDADKVIANLPHNKALEGSWLYNQAAEKK